MTSDNENFSSNTGINEYEIGPSTGDEITNEPGLPKTIGEVRLIGTAHVSAESVNEVKTAIDEWQPDVVAIELDKGRYLGLKRQQRNPEVEEIIESKNFTQILMQWILAYIQRRIGMDVGVEPGAEMKAAIDEVETRGIELALIDRDIRITLHRFWHCMSFYEKLKMLYALCGSLLMADKTADMIDIEELKKEDMVTAAMNEFHRFSPRGAYALISERDAYMAYNLVNLRAKHHKVLAVIGAGHRKGIEKYLASPETLPPAADLIAQVKTRPWGLIIGVLFLLMFAFLIVTIIFSGAGLDVLITAILYWVLINGVLTFVFTLIAGGHILSALVGFCISPISSLHPLIAAGWFSAIMEAKIRKPKPSDMRKIMDATSFSEMMSVPLFKVVLVAALANLGSSLGTVLYFMFIFPIIGIDPIVLISTGFSNMINAINGIF